MRWAPFLAVLLVVGCSTKPQLSGSSWTAEMMNFPATLNFESNGASELKITSPLGDLAMKGTFSETDDSVTLNIQQIDVPPAAKQGNRMLDRIKGAPLSFKLEWKSADEVTMSPLAVAGIFGKSVVMRRKKD